MPLILFTQEAERGEFWVWGHPALYCKFQVSRGYIVRPPSLKKKKNEKSSFKKEKKIVSPFKDPVYYNKKITLTQAWSN